MDLLNSFNTNTLTSVGDTAYNTIMLLLALSMIAGIVFYIYHITRFKHKFRIKEVVHDRKIIIDDKARDYTDKDGATYWKLLKRKDIIPMPPPESIELDNKGKKCVEAYRVETGEYIYLKDTGKVADPPPEILNIEDKETRLQAITKWKKTHNVVEAFQPLTTNQRIILINQIKKAHEKRSTKWQEYIIPVAGIGALVMIAVSLMIFYGDMGKPLIEMGKQLNNFRETDLQIISIIQEMKQDIQVIRSEQTGNKEPPN